MNNAAQAVAHHTHHQAPIQTLTAPQCLWGTLSVSQHTPEQHLEPATTPCRVLMKPPALSLTCACILCVLLPPPCHIILCIPPAPPPSSLLQAVIFCNTKRKVDWLTEKMRASNFTVSAMHGDMPQKVGAGGGGSASACHRSGILCVGGLVVLVCRWVGVGATHTVCGRRCCVCGVVWFSGRLDSWVPPQASDCNGP